jgi:hypothetical protein
MDCRDQFICLQMATIHMQPYMIHLWNWMFLLTFRMGLFLFCTDFWRSMMALRNEDPVENIVHLTKAFSQFSSYVLSLDFRDSKN